MSSIATLTNVLQELAEAGRELAKLDALRAEHGGDPSWNRLMDGAVARLSRAVADYDRWQSMERELSRLTTRLARLDPEATA